MPDFNCARFQRTSDQYPIIANSIKGKLIGEKSRERVKRAMIHFFQPLIYAIVSLNIKYIGVGLATLL